jgi:hypothetical protein
MILVFDSHFLRIHLFCSLLINTNYLKRSQKKASRADINCRIAGLALSGNETSPFCLRPIHFTNKKEKIPYTSNRLLFGHSIRSKIQSRSRLFKTYFGLASFLIHEPLVVLDPSLLLRQVKH